MTGRRPLRVAVLGGGTGIPSVLRGLSERVGRGEALDVTAVVATADDGGSSGRIRRERGGLPPGDLRNCLLALAPDPEGNPLARLLAHRFHGAGPLSGHSVGNLMLHALAEQEGSFVEALATAGSLIGARGRVLPVTLENVSLEGETRSGERLSGETRIGRTDAAIERVWLEPSGASPAPDVASSIEGADLLVVGPGSLFTSLLAVLLVPGVAEAARRCRGTRVLVANLMTQPGETMGMTLPDHLEALDRHLGPGLFDAVLFHDGPIAPARLSPYLEERAAPLRLDGIEKRKERLLRGDLVTAEGKIRHDPRRLAATIVALASSGARPPARESAGAARRMTP